MVPTSVKSVSFSAAAVLFGLYLLVAVGASDSVAMELPTLAGISHVLEFVLLIAISVSLGIAVVTAGDRI